MSKESRKGTVFCLGDLSISRNRTMMASRDAWFIWMRLGKWNLHNLTRISIFMTRDGPLWLVVLSVCSGASIGASLRWTVTYWLNPIWSVMPLGTLCVNLLGCYLIGVAVAWLTADPSVPPAVRLFLLTGFLGGLTAFSAFSGENVACLQRQNTCVRSCICWRMWLAALPWRRLACSLGRWFSRGLPIDIEGRKTVERALVVLIGLDVERWQHLGRNIAIWYAVHVRKLILA